MKLVKLSLVAALAAGTFSVANATPLEEVIKDIDVSGLLRYRYEGGTLSDNIKNIRKGLAAGIVGNPEFQDSLNRSKQEHKYRAQLNFSGAIADNFKAFIQFQYNAKDGGYGVGNNSDTTKTFNVRQLYLTYTNEDVATSVIAGKQQLNTLWTDNGSAGLVGTGVKVVNNSIDGLTLAAFGVDSFDQADGDRSDVLNWNKNLYGAAAIGSYDVGFGQLNPQLWLAYMDENAFLYALDTAYSATIFDGINWTLEGAYLGNSLNNKLKDANKPAAGGSSTIANGNFFALRGSIDFNGWDASLGGLYYGKEKKGTITVIEDQGNIGSLLAGEEIFWTDGSKLNGDTGKNIFGYVTAGYTFNETVRVGGDFVYGGTKTGVKGNLNGGDKLEAVARIDYKYSPKLNFSAFYSYVNIDNNAFKSEQEHSTVRLQALYKF